MYSLSGFQTCHLGKTTLLQILSFPWRNAIPWVQMRAITQFFRDQIRKKSGKHLKLYWFQEEEKKTITYRVTFCCGFSEKYSHEFIHPHSGSPVCDVLCGDHNIFGRCRLSRKSLLTGRRLWIVIASIYFLFSLFFCFLCENEIPSHYGLDPLGTISQNTAFSSLTYFLLEYYRYIIKATSALYSAKMFSIRYHY